MEERALPFERPGARSARGVPRARGRVRPRGPRGGRARQARPRSRMPGGRCDDCGGAARRRAPSAAPAAVISATRRACARRRCHVASPSTRATRCSRGRVTSSGSTRARGAPPTTTVSACRSTGRSTTLRDARPRARTRRRRHAARRVGRQGRRAARSGFVAGVTCDGADMTLLRGSSKFGGLTVAALHAVRGTHSSGLSLPCLLVVGEQTSPSRPTRAAAAARGCRSTRPLR